MEGGGEMEQICHGTGESEIQHQPQAPNDLLALSPRFESDATFVLEATFTCHCNLSDPLEPPDFSRSEHAESLRYEPPLNRLRNEIPTE